MTMQWSDRVEALRALGGELEATDWLFAPSSRYPYRYVTVSRTGTDDEIADVSGEWIRLAGRVNGYVSVVVIRAGVKIQIAIDRPLTDEEIAKYDDVASQSFEVVQP